MELNEDLDEREVQIDNILDNPNCTKEDIIYLYDGWNETYDEVRTIQCRNLMKLLLC